MLASGHFTIGRVFRLLPKVMGQESISLWLMFSGIGGALNLLSVMLQYGFGAGSLIASLIALFFSLAMSLAACFVHYAAIHAADRRLSGTPLQAVQALWIASRRFWDYLAMALLMGFVVIVGMLMLVIPGLFAWIAFSLALPALALRQFGISESMHASWLATEGRRWRLLGVWLIYAVAGFMALVCVGLLFAALFHLLGLGPMTVQILMVSVMDPVFAGASIVVTGAVSTTVFRLMELEAPEILAA